jgi:hypothetical protein
MPKKSLDSTGESLEIRYLPAASCRPRFLLPAAAAFSYVLLPAARFFLHSCSCLLPVLDSPP